MGQLGPEAAAAVSDGREANPDEWEPFDWGDTPFPGSTANNPAPNTNDPHVESTVPPGATEGTKGDIDAATTTEQPQRRPGTETDDDDGALSERDVVMAQALGAGHSQTSAAELVGLSAKTVKRRLDDPAFAAAVASARRSFLDQILGKLSQAGIEAADTLVELLSSGRPADRLRAAEAVLSHAARYSRQLAEQDIATRLDRLEAILLEKDQPADGRGRSEGQS